MATNKYTTIAEHSQTNCQGKTTLAYCLVNMFRHCCNCFSGYRLYNFTIGLTEQLPDTNHNPLESPFQMCIRHGRLGMHRCVRGEPLTPGDAASLTCSALMYAWGRYLFVAANVHDYFHLTEVEVFDGRLIRQFMFLVKAHNKLATPSVTCNKLQMTCEVFTPKFNRSEQII